jgi:fibronectin type 3 domain-containing protein
MPPIALQATSEKHIVHLTWQSQPSPDLAGYYIYRAEGAEELSRLRDLPLGRDTTEYTDSGSSQQGLIPGKGYRYGVSQVDTARNESPRDSTQLLIPDDQPPTPPDSVHCQSTGDGRVQITWQVSMAPDVTRYRVYRQEAGMNLLQQAELPSSARDYTDSSVTRGREYGYLVAAVDSAGNEGQSETYEVVPADTNPPAAPKELKVKLGATGVDLTWQPATDSDLAGYNVYRSDTTRVPAKLNQEPLTDTTFADSSGGARYFYWVQALDTSGNESERSEILWPKE